MVVITFKTITQLSFTLEVDPSLSVADVKAKIAQEKGDDYAVELQKLIYNGKILDDATSVDNVGYDPAKFVVVMLARKKTAAAPSSSEPASDEQKVEQPTETKSSTTAPAQAPAVTAPPPLAAMDNLTPEQTALVESIVAMGYTPAQATTSLRLADWNGDRAVDLLLGGIEEGYGGDEGPEAPMGGAAAGLEELEALPQINELREFIRTNPAALPALMQQIAQLNPRLMDMISNNQEAFLRMLTSGGGPEGAGGRAAEQGGGAPGPGQVVIELTREEAAAVDRIKSMGFRVPEALILEAFLACDKNEELAINYIMNMMDHDDGGQD